MPRRKGSKCVPEDVCKTAYKMSVGGVRNKDIAEHYSLARSTISSIIHRYKKQVEAATINKMGRERKLADRGLRLLQRYKLANCFEPLYVIICHFSACPRLQLSVTTVRLQHENDQFG